jgi:hypothetical protein
MSDLPLALQQDMLAFSIAKDRFDYLRLWLARCGIKGKKIEIAGKRHLLVRFAHEDYRPDKPIKIFVAHYDKVPNSPGANDNGAAVFQLLCHAGRLALEKSHGNVQILFTDGEEILGEPITTQGTYQLAAFFRRSEVENCQFYVFDMCGIGDCLTIGGAGTVVLAQALSHKRISQEFYDRALEVIVQGEELLKSFQGRSADWVYSSFSDDLGFLLNGYSAVYFSVLPTDEAALVYANWQAVENNAYAQEALDKGYLGSDFQKLMRPLLPKSWQTWHTKHDKIELLEKRAFLLMEDFLTFLTFK